MCIKRSIDPSFHPNIHIWGFRRTQRLKSPSMAESFIQSCFGRVVEPTHLNNFALKNCFIICPSGNVPGGWWPPYSWGCHPAFKKGTSMGFLNPYRPLAFCDPSLINNRSLDPTQPSCSCGRPEPQLKWTWRIIGRAAGISPTNFQPNFRKIWRPFKSNRIYSRSIFNGKVTVSLISVTGWILRNVRFFVAPPCSPKLCRLGSLHRLFSVEKTKLNCGQATLALDANGPAIDATTHQSPGTTHRNDPTWSVKVDLALFP